MQDIVDEFKRQIREVHEPNFRKRITDYLQKHFNTKNKRKKEIRNNKNLNWIGRLYPTVYTDEKKIYFLSIDKFFVKNTTLIEPPYYFNESKLTENSLIFIDEFDSTKNNILSNIIDKGIKQKIDFIQLFNGIHLSLLNNVFPKQLLSPSEDLQEKRKKYPKILLPDDQIDSFKKKADKICEDFKLKVSYKTDQNEFGDNTRSLLFHDFRYHAVLKGDKKYIKVNSVPEEQLNRISFVNEEVNDKKESILSLLNNIKGFINYFQKGIKFLATNYHNLKKETNSDLEYSFESALWSVLEEFSIETKHKNFLVDNIMAERYLSSYQKENKSKLKYDLSAYQNGFQYYDFVDSDLHATVTKIYLYSFQNSPEKFILKLSEKAKVVGISATSTMETVTGNYDINYLSNQLGNNFYQLTDEEIRKIKDEFNDQYPDYENRVNIIPTWLKQREEVNRSGWLNLFENEELADEIFNRLPSNTFYQHRYFKVAYVFKQFLLKEDIQSLLCMLNAFPKSRTDSFDEEITKEIFEYLIKITDTKHLFTVNGEFDVNNSFIIIKSKYFDAQKEGLIDKLENGRKLFIISTYQTVGAGQNLQFKPKTTEGLVKFLKGETTDWNKDNKTDINAIFLDSPTNLLVNAADKNLKEEDFAKYLFQLEFLQEHGDISMYHLNQEVKFAFKNLISSIHTQGRIKRPSIEESLYKKYNYSQHVSKIIIQAIGRICRTNLKSKNIYLFADHEIYKHIQKVDTDKQICLWEFLKLKETKPNSLYEENKEESQEVYTNLANTTNKKAQTLINKFLDTEWSIKRIEEWKNLREMTLYFPIMTEEEAKKYARLCQLYIQLPEVNDSYSFEKKEDFNDITIDFSNNSTYHVSESSCRLNELMEIPGLKQYFEQNNWATKFKKGNYILPPALFTNIYKGVLGEVVGKFIFENQLGVKLKEIENEDYFEYFDFKINDYTYVDFKHWGEMTYFTAKKEKQNIYSKLDSIGAEKVFIINLLSETESPSLKSSDSRIIEIPYLFDVNSKTYNKEAFKEIISNIKEYATYQD